jgi:hypothetical protein
MSQKQLNYCSRLNFVCDSCGREFEQEIAYSPASNLEELKYQPIYCIDCVNITKEEPEKRIKKKWETPPVEASENLTSLNVDRRSLTKTGRTYQLGTRVRKEFLENLKKIAYEERLKLVEVLEKALECYNRHREK